MAVQVVNAIGNTLWTTDKVEFATTLSNVTFQVSAVQLTYAQANGTPANASMGAGNYLYILTGATGFTATAVGSATSATAGSNGI